MRRAGVGLVVLGILGLVAPISALAAGELDSTFSRDGRVITDIPGQLEIAKDAAVTPQGKIVAVGFSAPKGFEGRKDRTGFALARYKPNGRLDRSFADDGMLVDLIQSQTSADAVAVQPDGKIIVAGTSKRRRNPDYELIIARYNEDGSRDKTFGSKGHLIGLPPPLALQGDPEVAEVDVVVQPDGKVVVAGAPHSSGAADDRGFLLRLTENGRADPSFSDDGLIVGPADEYTHVVLLADGSIVAAGSYFCEDCYEDQSGIYSEFDLALARFRPDGTPDTSFSADGLATVDLLPNYHELSDQARGIGVDSGGRLVALGMWCQPIFKGGICPPVATALRSDGSIDAAYGDEGLAHIPAEYNSTFPTLAVTEGGTGVVAYTQWPSGRPQTGDFVMHRLAPDGLIDSSFGASGTQRSDLTGKRDQVFAAAPAPGNRVLVVGAAPYGGPGDHPVHFALARYDVAP